MEGGEPHVLDRVFRVASSAAKSIWPSLLRMNTTWVYDGTRGLKGTDLGGEVQRSPEIETA